MNRAWIVFLGSVAALAIERAAYAQPYQYYPTLGQFAAALGDAIADEDDKKCQKGRPPSESQIQNARTNADNLMSAFSKLGAASSASEVKRVFNTRDPTSLWRDGTGLVQANQIAVHLIGPVPSPKLISFVAGGDGQSGHGVWQAPANAPEAKAVYYVAEFRVSGGAVFPGWKIWRMAIVQSDAPPPAPSPFCHLNAGAMW